MMLFIPHISLPVECIYNEDKLIDFINNTLKREIKSHDLNHRHFKFKQIKILYQERNYSLDNKDTLYKFREMQVLLQTNLNIPVVDFILYNSFRDYIDNNDCTVDTLYILIQRECSDYCSRQLLYDSKYVKDYIEVSI